MEAPPCLTCNGGSPCKDLAIGFSELDAQKYELHIKTTAKAIEAAKQYGRDDMAEKHEKNLQRYQGILNNIQSGNIIFGRQDRIKRKVGATKANYDRAAHLKIIHAQRKAQIPQKGRSSD
jgi:hypothetical protein